MVVRTVVYLGKQIVAVRVHNMSTDERVVCEGTDVTRKLLIILLWWKVGKRGNSTRDRCCGRGIERNGKRALQLAEF